MSKHGQEYIETAMKQYEARIREEIIALPRAGNGLEATVRLEDVLKVIRGVLVSVYQYVVPDNNRGGLRGRRKRLPKAGRGL